MTEEDTNRADPPRMEVDPQAEALARLREMGFGEVELRQAMDNAVLSSFLPDAARERLARRLDAAWAAWGGLGRDAHAGPLAACAHAATSLKITTVAAAACIGAATCWLVMRRR